LVRVLHVKGRNAKGRPGRAHLWFLQLIDFYAKILKPSAQDQGLSMANLKRNFTRETNI
jgi:hypothetical protein